MFRVGGGSKYHPTPGPSLKMYGGTMRTGLDYQKNLLRLKKIV